MWCAHTVSDKPAIAIVAAEHRLAGEDGEDFGGDAEERQRHDVDLRMAEEPEQVLPQDRPAAVGGEHLRTELAVDLQH